MRSQESSQPPSLLTPIKHALRLFTIASSRLFTPVKLGANHSIHRVALAPLTRMRTSNQVISELAPTYYEQRASEGGLLISETCFISVESGGWPLVPGELALEFSRPPSLLIHLPSDIFFFSLL